MEKNKPREPMPVSERAKQFAPFSPLHGLHRALAEKEKIREPRREISEEFAAELNTTLCTLERGRVVTVYYYDAAEQPYRQLTGAVTSVDAYKRTLTVEQTVVSFDDLFEITVENT